MQHTSETLATAFTDYLKEHNRYEELPELIRLLEKEAYRNQNITVVTASALSAAEKKELEAALTKKWGEHAVLFAVDPILLSGMIVTFQDRVIDTSGKHSLADLKHELI